MKIALPTNDGISISPHFGRSAGFIVFDIEEGRIGNREIRPNAMQHSHAQGACDHSAGAQGPHDHGAIVGALAGCDVVICAGMGWRAAEALKSAGITEVIVAPPGPAESAVAAYLAGQLSSGGQHFCHCNH
jgi:predicted Fe-Mo cluster-binding NifX family protein